MLRFSGLREQIFKRTPPLRLADFSRICGGEICRVVGGGGNRSWHDLPMQIDWYINVRECRRFQSLKQ
jgi:hypothetical protein